MEGTRTMAPLSKTDVVIIGMGAAGGIASYVLTRAGLRVVGIEAGPRWTRSDFIKQLDELGGAFNLRNELGAPKFNKEIPTWRPDARSPAQPPIVFGMANGVGGSSIHYGAQSWRFLADDFTIRSTTVARYGQKALPKGSAIADWPVTSAELEPYYDNVEYLIGVSGKAGANPFESPRRRAYPLPPLRTAGYLKMVSKAYTELGYHPFPQPAAVLSQPYHGRSACTFCGFCGYGFGCWNDSKSSTLVSAITEAEKTGKLEIRPNSRVMKILSDSGGNVTGVQYLDAHGQLQEQPASFVIVGGYVYENTRLLLLSKARAYPNGLSNNHGQLGKYYIAQAASSVSGLYPNTRLNLWGGTSGQAILIDDLNGDNFDHSGLGFIRGASIQASTNIMPILQATTVPPEIPLWGSAYKSWLQENFNSVGGLTGQMDTLPYEGNFIDLDPTVKDPLGIPVARLTFNYYQNEYKMAAYLTNKLTKIHQAAGATKTWGGALTVIAVHSHAYGGTRMGDDPASSVVNEYSISHEAPNLAVMGGSTFVSTSGYNPTETIQALAWYGAEYIAKNFNKLAV
jgi:gluconate 2-dehydrogenase alpha chain